MRALAALALFCAFVSGCSLVGGPDRLPDPPLAELEHEHGVVSLRTDRTAYVARKTSGGSWPLYEALVVARLANRTSRPVTLERCYPDSRGPIFGVELVGAEDEWGAAYDRAWACVGHDNPIVVPAGGVRVDTLRLQGPTARQGGRFLGALDGDFRVTYRAGGTRVASNTFAVRVSR